MPVVRLHPGAVISDPGSSGGTATIVGPAPQWDDGSDATYAVSQTDATGSTSFRSPIAPLDLLPGGIGTIMSVTVHLRYSTSWPDGLPAGGVRAFQYGIFEPDGSGYFTDVYVPNTTDLYQPAIPNDDAIHEFTWVIWPFAVRDSFNDFIGSELLRAFKSGSWFGVQTLVPPGPSFKQSATTAYECWVEVEYAGVSVLRQWPRDDAYGANATPRHFPPPRSQRHIGGQP